MAAKQDSSKQWAAEVTTSACPLALIWGEAMKLKITPGEWETKGEDCSHDRRYIGVKGKHFDDHVASVYGDGEEETANRLAISRVPEMLAFIKTALKESDNYEALTSETWYKGKALLKGLVDDDSS